MISFVFLHIFVFSFYLINDLDISKFRKDINPQKAIELIIMFLNGMNNKYISTYRNRSPEATLTEIEKIIDEAQEYFEILKKGIYK